MLSMRALCFLLACSAQEAPVQAPSTDVSAAQVPAEGADLPGVVNFSDLMRGKLQKAFRQKGPTYKARTHHKNKDGTPKFINRLIFQTSPYLLQHAHNPVNWFPWGDEAFAEAKRLDRPVLLSVGYSTCHWCHVMERESFEDEEIAEVIEDGEMPLWFYIPLHPDAQLSDNDSTTLIRWAKEAADH